MFLVFSLRFNKRTLSKFLKSLGLSRVCKYNLFVAARILYNGNLPFWSIHRGYICSIVSNFLLEADPRYFFLVEKDFSKILFPDLVPQIFILFFSISETSISIILSWAELSQTCFWTFAFLWNRIKRYFVTFYIRKNISIFCYRWPSF